MKTKNELSSVVSRETIERLEVFEKLLLKWTPKINLIARNDMSRVWQRHIMDSAQIYHLTNSSVSKWFDLGSGGGFPGIVCAAIAAERMPMIKFFLVESDVRKAVFLRQAVAALSLNATVHAKRIEDFEQGTADVISARALAPLDTLLTFAEPLLHDKTLLLFPKGRNVDAELKIAELHWDMKVERIPSLTDAEATVLRITRVGKRL